MYYILYLYRPLSDLVEETHRMISLRLDSVVLIQWAVKVNTWWFSFAVTRVMLMFKELKHLMER